MRTGRGKGSGGSKTHREDDGVVREARVGQTATETSLKCALPKLMKTTTPDTESAPAGFSLTKRTVAPRRSPWCRRLGAR
jgi:hypothetical protein